MNLEIIQADFNDAEILIEMMKEFHLHESIDSIEKNNRKLLIEIFSQKELGEIYLIKVDDKFAGYFLLTFSFSIEFSGKFIFVDELYLRENFRGKGIGKKCINFIEEKCREMNISFMRLEVSRLNSAALKLYQSTGFIDHKRDLLTKFIK